MTRTVENARQVFTDGRAFVEGRLGAVCRRCGRRIWVSAAPLDATVDMTTFFCPYDAEPLVRIREIAPGVAEVDTFATLTGRKH